MATIAITSQTRAHGHIVVLWETMGNADVGASYQPPVGYDLESVHAFGTWGSATLKMQGSNEPTASDFQDLEDTGLVSGGFIKPNSQALHYRPETSGGTGTDVDVYALFRQKN